MLKAGLATQTEGATGTGPHGTKVVQPPPAPAEIAALFPQLEILECLGRGGMGVVYKARQPRLNRLVALKILAREKEQDAQFAERFTREAQALARLNHPNIVTVHDFGTVGQASSLPLSEKQNEKSETGKMPVLHYLLMEFVDGLNLRQLLQARKMPSDQALTIVPKICEALQYAHEQGIVHRDIKPENILLDKSGRVKIADFGIAKMLGDEPGQQTLTGAKDAVGTPHYMAPEQIEKPLSVDHRADIYSLGVVFYEMLTGELPLGKFQPPSKKVQIDVRLDEVVLHALEKEPELRYQQASQVKTAVETIAATAPGGSPSNQNAPVQTAAEIEAVRKRLKIPGRGLIAAAGLQLLTSLGLLIFAIPAVRSEGGDPAGYAAVSFGAAVFLVFAAIGLFGATSMLKLRNYSFSVVASVVAAVAGPGAILGLPFGVWALVVLFRREVRAAFATTRSQSLPSANYEKMKRRWSHMSPLMSPEALEIAAHMTPAEERRMHLRGLLFGIWNAATWFVPLGILFSGPGLFNHWPLALVVWLVGIGFFPVWINMIWELLCSTDWARAQGIKPGSLPRYSFGRINLAKFGVHYVVFALLAIGLAVVTHIITSRQLGILELEQSIDVKIAQSKSAIKSDYIGQTWFPRGDSIEITSVERTKNQMTVKGHYNLVSHNNALLALYITTSTNRPVPEDPSQRMEITKGQNDFELIHPFLEIALPGLPHVSMYADSHPFASLYFGTQAEALDESKAGWITNASSASALQFRLVLPTDSTGPADWLPSASSGERLQLSRQVLLDDTDIAQAGVDFDRFGRRMIEIRFTDTGAKKFEAITTTNIGRQLAIVFRGRVLSAPVIQSVIPNGECTLNGSMNASEVDQIVDCLNRFATPSAGAWNFSPVRERILPFKPQPEAVFGWLDLDSGTVITNSMLDWQSRSSYDWIRSSGSDVVTTESAKHFPTLLGIDMILAPAPTNGWDIVTPADVIHDWPLLQEEPQQKKVFSAIPGQTDTFVFQTREGGKGVLQILGFAENSSNVKLRYKLVQSVQAKETETLTVQNGYFDSVMEQTIADDTAIDLTSGRQTALPESATRPGNGTKVEDAICAWMRRHPVDFAFSKTGWVYGMTLNMVTLKRDSWDHCNPQQLAESLRGESSDLRVKFGYNNPTGYTFGFKNRDGKLGLLQITGFTERPPGVQIRYKLVQPAVPESAIDPATGLPIAPGRVTAIDPATGLPVTTPSTSGNKIDSTTGLPVTPNHASIDPTTGLPTTSPGQ